MTNFNLVPFMYLVTCHLKNPVELKVRHLHSGGLLDNSPWGCFPSPTLQILQRWPLQSGQFAIIRNHTNISLTSKSASW